MKAKQLGEQPIWLEPGGLRAPDGCVWGKEKENKQKTWALAMFNHVEMVYSSDGEFGVK